MSKDFIRQHVRNIANRVEESASLNSPKTNTQINLDNITSNNIRVMVKEIAKIHNQKATVAKMETVAKEVLPIVEEVAPEIQPIIQTITPPIPEPIPEPIIEEVVELPIIEEPEPVPVVEELPILQLRAVPVEESEELEEESESYAEILDSVSQQSDDSEDDGWEWEVIELMGDCKELN